MTCFTLRRFLVNRMLSVKAQSIVLLTIPTIPFTTPGYCIRSIWTCLTVSPCYTTSCIRSIWTCLTVSPCYTTSCIRSIWTCLTVSPCYTTSCIRSIWTCLTVSPCYTTSCIRSIWTCLTARSCYTIKHILARIAKRLMQLYLNIRIFAEASE